MKDILAPILDFLKISVVGKWTVFFRVLVLIILGYAIFFIHQVYINKVIILDPEELIIIRNETVNDVDKALHTILETHHCIKAIGVYVYQPKKLPKYKVQLVTMEHSRDYTNMYMHKALREDSGSIPLNNYIYRSLMRSDVIDIDKNDTHGYGAEIEYDYQINYVRVYGLYKYGSPFGSVVVLLDRNPDEFSREEFMEKNALLYLQVRYINKLMFDE